MNKNNIKKAIICIIAGILVLGMFTGCGKQNDKYANAYADLPAASYSNITPVDAKARLDSEKGIILLDVRTKEEYDSGHIKDAVLIPVDVLEKEAVTSLKDKKAVIFVYCRSGNRSVTASNILVKLGYTNVYNLGGIKDWPYEVVR